MTSTHQAELVKVNLRKHPNADKLSLIDIYGYTYVGQTEKWESVAYGIWFCPDTLVDTTRPEFSELLPDAKFNADSTKGGVYARIKAKKLRGVVSYGYMIPAAPEDNICLGLDILYDKYGAKRYEPPLISQPGKGGFASGGEVGKAPSCYHVKYDVDSFLRYGKEVFVDGEPVVVTEKIHGANGRWVFHNGEFYCGSRTEWKKEFATPPDPAEIEMRMREKLAGKMDEVAIQERVDAMKAKHSDASNTGAAQNMWWKALRQYPEMMAWLERNPDTVLYGEVYGQVQNLKYGTQPGEVRIALFDILKNGQWVSHHDTTFMDTHNLPWVPTLACCEPFNFDKLVEMAEGQSLIEGADHIKEGVCVRPVVERRHPSIGRVHLKIINPAYYDMK